MIDSAWKPGIGKVLVIDDVTTLLEEMASVLVEDWTGVDVEVICEVDPVVDRVLSLIVMSTVV